MGYGNDSLEAYEGARAWRERPATVLGTDDINGATHAVMEVVANAFDEAMEGYCNVIKVDVTKDGEYTIEDFGRGVPMGWNPKSHKYNWELVFCTPYASGKFNADNYNTSEGLNGIGDTAAQWTSEYMKVQSIREEELNHNGEILSTKVKYQMHFKKGYPSGELMYSYIVKENEVLIEYVRKCPSAKENTSEFMGKRVVNAEYESTGTVVSFKPDIEVFKGADSVLAPLEMLFDKLRRKAILLPGLHLHINYAGYEPIELYFKNGSADYIQEICGKKLIKNMVTVNGSAIGTDSDPNNTYDYTEATLLGLDVYKTTVKCAFTFSRDVSETEVYHNGAVLSEGGLTYDKFKLAVQSVIEDIGKKMGLVQKNDKIQYKDIEDLMVCVVETYCPGNKTSYKHQTKTAINNKFIAKVLYDKVKEQFTVWANSNKEDMKKVIEQVLINKKARESAEAIKNKVVNKLKSNVDTKRNVIKKLTECSSTNAEECELYLTEGDSASGSAIQARDPYTQAVMGLRGKTLNCLKASIEQILNSDVIVDIVRALGCGIEVKSKFAKELPKYDESKLRYSKVLICTDADFDGFHIVTLLCTVFYRLMPSLIKNGHVFVVETPLFIIKSGKERRYAYTDAERNAVVEEMKDAGYKKIEVQRLKGLGEMSADLMHDVAMNKENRRLTPVEFPTEAEMEETMALMNQLLGDDLVGRKAAIEQYFYDIAQTHELSGDEMSVGFEETEIA